MSQENLVWKSEPKIQEFGWLLVFPTLGIPLGIICFEFLEDGHTTYVALYGLLSIFFLWSIVSNCLPSIVRGIQERPYTSISLDGIVHGWRKFGWNGVVEVEYLVKEPTKMVFMAEGRKELFTIDLSDGRNEDYEEAHRVATQVIRKILTRVP